jgi:DNA-binding MarR family transcriptional regulator
VYRQGALGPYEVAPVELCQLGIVRALDVRQSALTKVLTRLVAAGVLATDRRHVEGQPRRLKVYQLTPLGESLARDLRRTFPSQFMTEPRPATAPAAR